MYNCHFHIYIQGVILCENGEVSIKQLFILYVQLESNPRPPIGTRLRILNPLRTYKCNLFVHGKE